jgi:hypothetical protein
MNIAEKPSMGNGIRITRIILIVSFWLTAGQAWSDENWYWKASGQMLLKSYNDSTELNDLSGFGVGLSGDYLERGNFTAAYNFNHSNYKNAGSDVPQEIDESILFLSGRVNYHPDSLPGRLTLRLDGYYGIDEMQFLTTTSGSPMGGGSSKKTVSLEDKILVMNPIVSFLNYAKSFYADLGVAFSSYRSDVSGTDDIDIVQWTPTIGLGFNRAYDWLQLRAYLIDLSSSNRVAAKESTSALEAKWTHWFLANAPLNLHSARLTVISGERIYAVDSDAYSLANVPDLQTGAISVGAEWKLSEPTSLLLQGGYETYESLLLNDRYRSAYMFLYLTKNW